MPALGPAFDKGDLLYLRDHEEQERHKELDIRDSEQEEFAALRARVDGDDEQPQQQRAAAAKPGKKPDAPPQRFVHTMLGRQPCTAHACGGCNNLVPTSWGLG